MINSGLRGKRSRDNSGILSVVEQYNQQEYAIPTVTSFSVTDESYVPTDDTAVDTAGGQTIVINGYGFKPGATITVGGVSISVVTYLDSNRLTFTAPAKSSGSYTIVVSNASGGTGILVPGLVYSGLPTFTTSAGSLGSVYETNSISEVIESTGDTPITYSLYSGTLPDGATLNSDGTITGTAPVESGSTTYSFTIKATDAELQDSTRSFSLTINTDVVTWSSPDDHTLYSVLGNEPISNVTLSATSSAGKSITYSANTLPNGVYLSGNTIYGTPTTEETIDTALTATAATTNRSSVRYISWSVVLGDTFFENVTLLLNGEINTSTFNKDSSNNNFGITIYGDTKSSTYTPYFENGSAYFVSGYPYLSVPSNSAFDFGTGDFTVEFWFNVPSGLSNNARFISNAAYNASGIDISWESGQSRMTWYIGGTNYSTATLPSTGVWHHIAFSRSGTTLKIFLDGALSNTYNGMSANISGGTLYIGGYNGASNTLDGGYMSNIRLVKGTAIYTSAFTPSTTQLTAVANTSLLVCSSASLIDRSLNNFTLSKNGTVNMLNSGPAFSTTPTSNGSAYFDGTGDYLVSPISSIGTGDFTVECWLYIVANSGTGSEGGYLQTSTSSGGLSSSEYGSTSLTFARNNPYNQYFFQVGPTTIYRNTVGTLIGHWVHFAAVRSSGTVRLYFNGVLDSTPTSATTNITGTYLAIGGYYSTSYLMNGYMSDLRITNVAVYSGNFTPPKGSLTTSGSTSAACYASTANVNTSFASSSTLLLTLQTSASVNNSVFNDSGPHNHAITRNGNTTQGTFSPYGNNWGTRFSDRCYISSPASSNYDITDGDWTIEFWINIKALNNMVYSGSSVATNFTSSVGWAVSFDNYGTDMTSLNFGCYNGGWTTAVNTSFNTAAVPFGKWHHIAIVRNGSGSGNLKMYLNGVATGGTFNAPTYPGAGGDLYYGIYAQNYGYSGNPDMYLSNFRLVKGTAVYTSDFTPSTQPLTAIANTKVLTFQSNRFVDNSNVAATMTVTTVSGSPSIQRYSPFSPSSSYSTSVIGGSGYFDGSGDYLSAESNSVFAVGTGDFAIQCWVYFTSVSGSILPICQPDTVGTSNSSKFWFGVSANKLYLSQHSTSNAATAPLTPVANQWYNLAVSRVSGTVYMWINGVAQTVTNSTIFSSTSFDQNGFVVGAISTPYYLSGYITGLQYQVGTGFTSYTLPTSPISTGTNAKLLLSYTNAGIIDNAMMNDLETVGNVQISTSVKKYGTGSLYFDGSGDYLKSRNNAVYVLASGDFTIEMWVYPTTTGTNRRLIGWQNGSASNSNYSYTMDITSSNKAQGQVIDSTTQYQSVSSADITANAWNHVAFVRSGTSVKLYLNGTGATAATTTTFNTIADGTLYIGLDGDGSSYPFTGYIDDLRVTKGVARYTTDFTPPAALLTR